MWIALFIISIAAAICFSVAAILVQPPNQTGDANDVARGAKGTGAPIRVAGSPTHGSGNTALLLRRMQSLHLDLDEFRRSKPVAFRELLLRCEACESRACCASDLADDLCRDWRDYCPNGAMLNALSTLRDCYSTPTNRSRH